MFVKDIIKITNGLLINGKESIKIETFSIDTRTINKDDLYISIKGEKLDGNDYIEDAFIKNASGVIYQGEINNNLIDKYSNKIFIKVNDTIKSLQDLARYKRNLYNIPVVAITGSVGKTSTKDIIASVMKEKYNVLSTVGNFNNHIGLPLTLLKLKDHDAMCIEMGMNHFNELSLLTNILKPTIALITNIGTAHIGNLGSRENILKAKLEILEGLIENNVVINNDNDLLHEWNKNNSKYNVTTYGINNESDFNAKNIDLKLKSSNFDIKIDDKNYNIEVPVPGEHFILNSLAAITIGNILNIDMDKIKHGIENFELSSKRMEEKIIDNNITLLIDCYNANYDSMKAAIDVLKKYDKRKIAVLGDMLELGDFSDKLHSKIGKNINNIDILITVGEKSKLIANNIIDNTVKKYTCNTNEEASELLNKLKEKDDIILFKASNGMKFMEIVNKM